MNDAPLMAAYAELRALLADPNVPEGVTAACFRLSECQTKLFCTVPDGYRAEERPKRVEYAGTFDGKVWGLRFEPSNFLCELLAALRASEWPRVLVLVHDVLPPNRGDGIQLVSIAHPTGTETLREDINPQSTEKIEIELGTLPLLAALDSPETAFGPYAGKSLWELCKLAAAQIRALEAENHDLRDDITIMGNVLDDYEGRR